MPNGIGLALALARKRAEEALAAEFDLWDYEGWVNTLQTQMEDKVGSWAAYYANNPGETPPEALRKKVLDLREKIGALTRSGFDFHPPIGLSTAEKAQWMLWIKEQGRQLVSCSIVVFEMEARFRHPPRDLPGQGILDPTTKTLDPRLGYSGITSPFPYSGASLVDLLSMERPGTSLLDLLGAARHGSSLAHPMSKPLLSSDPVQPAGGFSEAHSERRS